MNKIWLIFQREFLNRVQKKSFLIATILVPLVFPMIIGVMGYIFMKQEEGAKRTVVGVLDISGKIKLESTPRYEFIPVTGTLDKVKTDFNKSEQYALLYIPQFDIENPTGITLYTKENPSIGKISDIEGMLESQIHDLKLGQYNIDKVTLKKLKTDISINNINLSETGEEKESNTGLLYILGFVLGILIYVFVLVYGMQIMLGVIEEKTSKIVEVIVSSVRPFQLMMGKILGIAAVGLLQFTIWAVLITTLSSATLNFVGLNKGRDKAMEQVTKMNSQEQPTMPENPVAAGLASLGDLPVGYILFNFAFYFLGGYLLYGALFAAVGAAVDSQQEAQQFNFPIMLPLIIGYFALFMSLILRMPMNFVMMWGCPKYPSPHPAAMRISATMVFGEKLGKREVGRFFAPTACKIGVKPPAFVINIVGIITMTPRRKKP